MTTNWLQGTFTALVTPFLASGEVDFDAFEKILEFQIANGVTGVVVGASTGENFALTFNEKTALLVKAVEIAKGRIKIIAGTGTNETKSTCDNTVLAQELGADAALVVMPYYNKPTQFGLYEHYRLVAEQAKGLPIIIYNIPGRSSVNMLPETMVKLANDFENIAACKEASGNIEQMMQIVKDAPAKFAVLSGDDSLTLPLIMVGGRGVISTISNYLPKEFSEMVSYALNGEHAKAREIHYRIFDLMKLNFIETNPGPVKYVMSQLGFCKEVYRLPMVPVAKANKNILNVELKKLGIIE